MSDLLPGSDGKRVSLPVPFSVKEEKTRKILKYVLWGIGAAGLYFLMPTLINFAGNIRTFLELIFESLLYGIGVIVAGGTLLWLATNKKIHALIKSFADAQVARLTKLHAESNPFAILDQYKEYIAYQLDRLDHAIALLRAQVMSLRDKLRANVEKMANEARKMKVARDSQDEEQKLMVGVFYREKKRIENRSITAKDLLVKMETVMKVLLKMRQVAQLTGMDINNEIEDLKERSGIATSAAAATDAATAVMRDNSALRGLYDMAKGFLNADFYRKMGELDMFVQGSDYFIKSNDIENGQIAAEALDFLSAWEQKGDSLLLSDDEKKELFSENSGVFDIDLEIERSQQRKPSRQSAKSTLGKKWTADL